jgi:hypothetical protein
MYVVYMCAHMFVCAAHVGAGGGGGRSGHAVGRCTKGATMASASESFGSCPSDMYPPPQYSDMYPPPQYSDMYPPPQYSDMYPPPQYGSCPTQWSTLHFRPLPASQSASLTRQSATRTCMTPNAAPPRLLSHGSRSRRSGGVLKTPAWGRMHVRGSNCA